MILNTVLERAAHQCWTVEFPTSTKGRFILRGARKEDGFPKAVCNRQFPDIAFFVKRTVRGIEEEL